MANYDAQINILVSGQRNVNNLVNQLNQVEDAITQIESRWRTASAALQRADIRLGVAGRQQPRGEGGRFASDPDRQARFNAFAARRLARRESFRARIGLRTASEQEASIRNQIQGNDKLLRQAERRIAFEQRLNSAVQLFETRRQKFVRGGGGSETGLRTGLQAQARALREEANSIQAAYDAAGGGASRNLRLVNALATGLGRVVEGQNELNRLQALGSKGFESGRRLQERISVVAERGVIPSGRIDKLRGRVKEAIAASNSGNEQAYSEALRAAKAAISRVERESKKLADDIAKNAPRSPILGGVNFPGSPKAEAEAVKRRGDALKENEKLSSAAVALEKQRQSALENIFQVEEKIRSSKRISFKDAQDYYFQAQLPRLALPFGDANQPAMRGGARRIGIAREMLGGARTADEAETAFRLIEERGKKAGKAIKQSFADAYQEMLPPDTLLSGLAALGKVGKTLASMKTGEAGQSGLQKALQSLQEARGARESFFGGASPAQAIDQIVREFNTGKPAASEAAGNITQSFASGLKKGTASSAAAAKSFASAAAQAIRDVFGIRSPSRFMIELVQNLVSTYIAEMQKSYPRIEAATQKAFGQETLLRDVKKLTATNKGFEFAGRTSTGFRPFPLGAGTQGVSREFQDMMSMFRKQIAELTTQPEIYSGLLNALPDSRITTDLAGAASRRAAAAEIPSFMSTQRMLGPGELEKTIAKAAADYFRTVRTPDPWVGLVGDYQKFIDGIIAATRKLTSLPALPPARVAGALPPSLFASGLSPAQELRRLGAYQRSQERSRAVMEGGAARGLALPPARGVAGALPPAAQRGLQDAISNLFSRISSAVRGAFGGAGGPRPPAGGFAGAAGGGGQGGQAQQIASLLGLDALGDISRVSTRELEALSSIFSELRAVLDPTIEGFDRLDNQLRETIGNIGRQVERRDPNADFLTRRFGPRAGRGISEGLIGGAFPLLFGQGIGASAGGLFGGAAGGFAGGGLGFGLSLIGTALGSAFDTFNTNLKELAKSLKDPTASLEAMKTAGLLVTPELEYLVQKLESSGRAAEAQRVIFAELEKQLGSGSVRQLQALNAEQKELDRQWQQLSATLTTALLPAITGTIAIVNDVINGFKGLSSVKLPPWLQKSIEAGADFQNTVGSVANPGFGLARLFAQNAINRGRQEAAKQSGAGAEDLTLRKQEEDLNKSIEAADKSRAIIQQGVALERSGVDLRLSIEDTIYGLRKRAADMEREAVEFRRSIEDEVFNKRQELEQRLAENERKRQQNAIDAFDLQLQKASAGLDPIAQGVVDAAREYLRIRAEGEADLQLAEKQLKLELQGIDQEVSRYKLQVEDRVSQMTIQRDEFSRDVSRARLQIERQIGDYVVQTEEYRLAMAKHRYEVEIDLEKKKQIVAQEGLGVPATGRNYANFGGFMGGRQMLHGIPGFAGYDKSHATPTNIHYHFAGKDPTETKAVAEYLKGLGYSITEFSGFGQRVGGHSRGSQHYRGNAFDIPGASMEGKGGMADIIAGQRRVHALIGDFLGARSQRTGAAGQAASAGVAAQVSSGAIGAAPVAPAPPAMPALPTAPQLVGINDLMQQYIEIVKKIKAATADTNKTQVESNRIAAERAFLAMQEQAMNPVRQAEQQTREIYEEIEARKLRNRLALEGFAPEVIEGQIRIQRLQNDLTKAIKGYDIVLSELIGTTYDGTTSTYESALAKLKELEAIDKLTPAQKALREELERILKARQGIKDATGAAEKGASDAAAASTVSPREKVEGRIGDLKKELADLIDPANQVIAAADAIGGAFSESFKGVISGSMSAQEALANFFQRTADYFLDMAAQIIQKWIVMTILNQALKLFPGGGGPGLSNLDAPATINNPLGDLGNIGGAYAKGGMFGSSITPFAMGGAFTNSIVSSPTLFKFAAGGVMNTGVMGEAGPEAIMPLSKGPGGRLGVDASGAGGGDISVTVNVDAKGTGVEGNQQQGAALGRVISAAVQAEIIKQQRPGGLLTR